MSRALALALLPIAGCLAYQTGPLPAAPGETYASVEGTRLHLREAGAGPPVLLLHGYGSSLEVWRGLFEILARDHRVVAVDLKGFGLSDRTSGGYAPAEQAELVAKIMLQRGIERYDLVAHSWGASVALALALAHPEAVGRLVLVSGWIYSDQIGSFLRFARAPGLGELLYAVYYEERFDESFADTFYDPSVVDQAMIDRIARNFEPPGTLAAALAVGRGMRYEAQEARYGEVRAPALLIWGQNDPVSRLRYGEKLAMQLPHARLAVYPRCGHFPMIEHPAHFQSDVAAFLSPRNGPR